MEPVVNGESTVEEPTTGWHLWTLRAGDTIRVTEDSPVRLVTRITSGAAYYEVVSENTYKVLDTKTGEDISITRKDRRETYIAPRSYVEMVERGPLKPRHVEVLPPIVPKAPRPELPPIEYKLTRRRKV